MGSFKVTNQRSFSSPKLMLPELLYTKQFVLIDEAKKRKNAKYTNSGTIEMSVQIVDKTAPPKVQQMLQQLQQHDEIELQLRGIQLENKDTLGKSGTI